MARTAATIDGARRRDEWSCRVCTLLNNWRERRCGACDTERPADAESPPAEWSCEVCTLVNEAGAARCAACEHERPSSTGSSTVGGRGSSHVDGSTPTREPHAPAEDDNRLTPLGHRPNRKRQRTPTKAQVTNPPTLDSHKPPSSRHCLHRSEDLTTDFALNAGQDHAISEPQDLPEAPSFNLLSFANNLPALLEPATTSRADQWCNTPEDSFTRGPSFSLLDVPTVDLTDDTPSAKFADNDAQLAKAGLRLSDSENDGSLEDCGRRRRVLRRRRSLQPSLSSHAPTFDAATRGQEEWECSVCTNINPVHSSQCDLCTTSRHAPDESVTKPSHSIQVKAPHQVNPSTTVGEAWSPRTSPASKDATFTCAICTNVNPGHLDQCELCETKRTTVACPVCTTLNDVNRKRCEVCETILDGPQRAINSGGDRSDYTAYNPNHGNVGDTPSDRYQNNSFDSAHGFDLESVGDFEDDVDDPYRAYTMDPTPPTKPTAARRQFRDDAEDISDNETHSWRFTDSEQPAQSKRPELQEFEHFLTVEDARLDYQCQIDYRSMFAESSRTRSYADRLQKRHRESQKRKRSASKSGSDQQPTKGKARGKAKALKAGGRNAKAVARRASTGKTTTKYNKRARETGKSRRSSAPTFNGGSAGVNHYDTLGEDIGDDVTTMAWEGVGSAGYF